MPNEQLELLVREQLSICTERSQRGLSLGDQEDESLSIMVTQMDLTMYVITSDGQLHRITVSTKTASDGVT